MKKPGRIAGLIVVDVVGQLLGEIVDVLHYMQNFPDIGVQRVADGQHKQPYDDPYGCMQKLEIHLLTPFVKENGSAIWRQSRFRI
jgi:hypothetical protein